MSVHPRAGLLPRPTELIDPTALINDYYSVRPDPSDVQQRVRFGTSGHRGSAAEGSFNEDHVAAIAQAVCDFRSNEGIGGPIFLGEDTHALSGPASATVVEVLTANCVRVMIDSRGGKTPTPAVSRAILMHNEKVPTGGMADGLIVTPSHNPPSDGGIKYNSLNGGPASSKITKQIEDRANQLLANGNRAVQRQKSGSLARVERYDFIEHYIKGLPDVVDVKRIAENTPRIVVDPLGGASTEYWISIADRFGIRLDVNRSSPDPTFRQLPLDWDGRIRMDCSSPYVMSRVRPTADAALALANDADADRHGIVGDSGLVPANDYLAVVIDYLGRTRTHWNSASTIGKTLVSSIMIDRVAERRNREVFEVPVGFKWFVSGLLNGSVAFGGEESAGASFLTKDGRPWTTDKDGILLALLAGEMLAVDGETPAVMYDRLAEELGRTYYERIDAPADQRSRALLRNLRTSDMSAKGLAGDPVTECVTHARGNREPIGGVKVSTRSGWFAARPSGTESTYKIYAESTVGADHLRQIQEEARVTVNAAIHPEP